MRMSLRGMVRGFALYRRAHVGRRGWLARYSGMKPARKTARPT